MCDEVCVGGGVWRVFCMCACVCGSVAFRLLLWVRLAVFDAMRMAACLCPAQTAALALSCRPLSCRPRRVMRGVGWMQPRDRAQRFHLSACMLPTSYLLACLLLLPHRAMDDDGVLVCPTPHRALVLGGVAATSASLLCASALHCVCTATLSN